MADDGVVTETHNDKLVQAESDFIAGFSQKLEDEGAAGTATDAGAGEGTATATAAEDPAKPLTEDPAKAGSGAGDGAGSGEGTGEDAGSGAADLGGDGKGTAAEGAEASGAEPSEAQVDERFKAAMEKHGAVLDLASLPKEVRPVVEQKLKNLEAGFTRAMQDLRGQQKQSVQDQAELRFQREKPAEFIVATLLANPEIADAVNQRLEEFETSPTAREYHGVIVKDARAQALAAVEAERTAAEEAANRAQEIERTAQAAAEAYGVPFDFGVEDKVAAHLAIHGDIDEPTIRAIAKGQAAKYQAIVRAQERDRSKQYVQQKVADRATAGLRVKPGSGTAPQPASKRLAQSDEEFIADFTARL